MMCQVISYSTLLYRESRARLFHSARQAGVKHCQGFSPWFLYRSGYYKRHRNILEQPRGAGYWLWKPYVILKTLEQAKQGDTILYLDSDFTVTSSLTPLFDLASDEQPIVITGNHGNLNRSWTKRDCFVLMGCDSSKYYEAEQVNGSPVLLRNCETSRAFVAEWLSWCEDERILTDIPNTCGMPDIDGFKDHRHDQSVLSLLAVKHGLPIFRNPSPHGNRFKLPEFRTPGELLKGSYADKPFANSPYGTLIAGQMHSGKPHPFYRLVRRIFRLLGQNV